MAKKEIATQKLLIGNEEEVNSQLDTILKEEATDLISKSKEFKVEDQASYIKAGEFIAGCQKLRGRIVDYWQPILDKAIEVKRKAEESRKGIVSTMDVDLNPIDEAVKTVSNEISRHLKAEAEAEKESARQALIEAGRKDDERRKREQEEAEKAKNQPAKDEDIWDAIAKDRPKEVKMALEPAIAPPVAVSKGIIPSTVKTDFLNMKVKTDIEVTLIKKSLLVKAVLAGKIPHDVLVVDLIFAKRWIKENDIKEIDGLKIEEVYKAKVK